MTILWRILSVAALAVLMTACRGANNRAPQPQAYSGEFGQSRLPTVPPIIPEFTVTISGATSITATPSNATVEFTGGESSSIVFRNPDLTVGLNFINGQPIEPGTYDASEIMAGTGNVGATFTARVNQNRLIGIDPAGTITIDSAGEVYSGSFDLTFNLMAGTETVSITGEFSSVPGS